MDALRNAAQLLRNGLHQQGHAALEEVQRIRSPEIVEIGMQLLQAPTTPDSCFEQFYAARVVRCAVVRDWNTHWYLHVESITSFVWQFLGSRCQELTSIPAAKGLQTEMCNLWCSVWKIRCFPGGSSCSCDLHVLEALASVLSRDILPSAGPNADPAVRIVLRSLLLQCLEEFGDVQRGKGAAAGLLPMAVHESCRQSFRDYVLPMIATAAFQWGFSFSSETSKSADALVAVWQAVLVWNYSNVSAALSGTLDDGADKTPEVLACQGDGWKQLFGVGLPTESGSHVTVLEIIMHSLSQCTPSRNSVANLNEQTITSTILQCIVQLSSIAGEDWDIETRVAHLRRCLNAAFSIAAGNLPSKDSVGLPSAVLAATHAVHRAVTCLGCTECVFVAPDILTILIQPLLELTQRLIMLIHESSTCDEEAIVESVDLALRTWQHMVHAAFADVTVLAGLSDTVVPTQLGDSAATVLKVFIHSKVTQVAARGSSTDEVETSHSAEYGETQTKLLAQLGREHPAGTATFLSNTLRSLSDEFHKFLTARQPVPGNLNEALWFVLSVTANFFADCSDSERNAIPNSIVSLALHWERQFPEDEARQEASNEVFGLMRLVLQLAAATMPFVSTGYVSPGVCQALVSAFAHYCGAYVFPDEMLQLDFSNAISTAFEGGVAVADCAMQVVATSLTTFSYDEDVTKACAKLLSVLSEKPSQFGAWAVTQKAFLHLVELAADRVGGTRLPGRVKSHVVAFVVSVCPLESVECVVMQPLVTSLQQIIHRAAAAAQHQLVDVDNVIGAVDSLGGAFVALRTEERTKGVFGHVAGLITQTALIVQVHGVLNKPLLVSTLQMMNTIVECCSFLASSSFVHVVELGIHCMQTVRIALKASAEKCLTLPKEAASLEEDERMDVLASAAKFVQSVATWGLMDMSSEDDVITTDSGVSKRRSDCIAELSVKGLLIILSFCDETALSIPQLRDVVFSLLQEVSQTFTGRFLAVTPDEAQALLGATNFALMSSTPQLNQSGYKVIESIAAHQYRSSGEQSSAALLVSFLEAVANNLTQGQADVSVAPYMANALWSLIMALGTVPTLDILLRTFSANPLLEGPFMMLKSAIECTNFQSRTRDARNKFSREVELAFLAIRGTRIR